MNATRDLDFASPAFDFAKLDLDHAARATIFVTLAYGVVRVLPDIAVEVVSSTPRDERRDRIEKMDEYAAFGVRFYWILDPGLQSLEIFELGGGRYARAARATEGRMEAVPGCAGLTIDLDELWAELSRLAPPEQ